MKKIIAMGLLGASTLSFSASWTNCPKINTGKYLCQSTKTVSEVLTPYLVQLKEGYSMGIIKKDQKLFSATNATLMNVKRYKTEFGAGYEVNNKFYLENTVMTDIASELRELKCDGDYIVMKNTIFSLGLNSKMEFGMSGSYGSNNDPNLASDPIDGHVQIIKKVNNEKIKIMKASKEMDDQGISIEEAIQREDVDKMLETEMNCTRI
mgnify:CR=1 FL=1